MFIKEAGYEPRVPEISIQARLNTIKAHKGHRSTAWKEGESRTNSPVCAYLETRTSNANSLAILEQPIGYVRAS